MPRVIQMEGSGARIQPHAHPAQKLRLGSETALLADLAHGTNEVRALGVRSELPKNENVLCILKPE